jgi:hypothetical protein
VARLRSLLPDLDNPRRSLPRDPGVPVSLKRAMVSVAVAAVIAVAAAAAGAGGQVAEAGGVPVRPTALAGVALGEPGSGTSLSTLSDVSAGSSGSAWAVGYLARTLAGPTDTVIERWSGKSWMRVKSPDPGASDNVLIGVSAVSRGEAWAVGGYEVGTSGRFRTLILRWNGTAWSKASSPDPGAAGSILLGVTAISPSSAWAVGYFQSRSSGPFRTLVLHWNGKAWSKLKSPDPSHGSNSLYGVHALSARSAWAVGNYCVARCRGSAGVFGTLVLRWNGRVWSKVKSPSASRASNVLVGVTATSPGNAWATGYSCPGSSSCLSFLSRRHVLILHWNGRAWSKAVAPGPGQLSELGEVTATSARNAWAVGDYCIKISNCLNFNRLRTLIVRWNGRKWSRVPSPNPGPASSLGGVTAVSSVDAWGTGTYCTTVTCTQMHALIVRWNGRRWLSVTVPPPSATSPRR